MIAVDTNILVKRHREDSPFHAPAAHGLVQLAEGRAAWAITWPCLHEFLAIVTHPRIYGPPTPLPAAIDQVEAWLESPNLVLLAETELHWFELRTLIAGGPNKIPGDLAQERGVAIAVAPIRSADGATRLLINPQSPLGGPLSWYEAQINSGEGWSLAGGLIPGSPVMLSGASANSGWGISSNHPDLSDTYTLEANPNDRYFYRFDGDCDINALEQEKTLPTSGFGNYKAARKKLRKM